MYGTYVRERDGATQLYHSRQTVWNFPVDGLYAFLEARRVGEKWAYEEGSLWYWRKVDAEEFETASGYRLDQLRPGEYVVITEQNKSDFMDWYCGS